MLYRPPVALVRCLEYDSAQVEASIRQAVESLGGINRFVKPGQRVFLKLNLLMRKRPEEAVTTHPVVVEAVVRLVQEAGGIPVIGDSPGGPYNVLMLKSIYAASGIQDVAEKTGAELNWDFGEVTVSCPEGKVAKSLTITSCSAKSDVVISVSKLKTHGMAVMTGAVKVLFGVVPGLKKPEYHFKLPRIEDFADLLVDICEVVKPVLCIMDAVVGMEGDGPSAGRPRKIGAVLASRDGYALDVVAAHLIGLKPEEVPTILAARKRGFTSRLEDVEVLGSDPVDLMLYDFAAPKGIPFNFLHGKVPTFVRDALMKQLRPKPEFIHAKCSGCSDCVRSCPPVALEFNEQRRPVVNLDKCIRCFCCQELCLRQAVEIKRSWLGNKLFH